MGDWSRLVPDLLALIATRISTIEDFMAFRGVCNSWRAAARLEKFDKSWPVPLLMFFEKEDSNDDYKFYSLSKNKICMRLSIPEVKDKNCLSSKGWLITVGESSGEMTLLNPFSRSQVKLPNIQNFANSLYYPEFNYLNRAVLSASPSDTGDFVLVVIHSDGDFLGSWKPGDESWTRIKNSLVDFIDDEYSDVNYYNGKFYTITSKGVLCVVEPDLRSAQHIFTISEDIYRLNLVESSGGGVESSGGGGELLVVANSGESETVYRLIQLDVINGSWKRITSLGSNAIFVGYNNVFSVDADSSSIIKPNCIYFCDDRLRAFKYGSVADCKNTGIYHIEDEKIENFDHLDLHSLTIRNSPLWIPPSF